MTQMDFVNAVNAFQTNVAAYVQASSATSAQYGIPRHVGDRGEVTNYVINADWAGLAAYCQSRMATLLSTMGSIAGEQSQVNLLYSQLFAVKPEFSTYYLAPGSNAEWQAKRAQLESDLLLQGLTPAEVETFLTKIDENGGQNGFNLLKGMLEQFSTMVNYAFDRHLSLYTYYHHTKAVCGFNLASAVPQVLPYNVSNKINSLKTSLTTRQTALFTKINSGDFAGLINACTTYSTWVDTKLQTEIIPILAYCYQSRQLVTSNFTNDGRRAMKACDLFQVAVYSKALFAWVKWAAQWHVEVKSRGTLISKAASLANAAFGISGTTVSVANLFNNPGAYDGVDVVTEGKIANLTVTHVTATKVISKADLLNSSGVTVKLVLAHIKLDSGGLVNGSYAKVSGKFKLVNAEAGNFPALSLSRLAMTEASKTNWNAWLRLQLNSIFEQAAHNLEMTFSAEPSGDGLINPGKYGTTCETPSKLNITNKAY